jgi:esterase
MDLFYRALGQGQPLIILHGLFGSSDNWLSQAKKLSEHYSVYLLDARNHGQSPHDAAHNYTAMSQDLLDFIQVHQLSHPYVIGHSMGGKTVMKFLTLFPGIIAKSVVADISPRFYTRHHDHILEGLRAIPIETLNNRQEADDLLIQYLPNLGERQFLLKNLYRTEEGTFKWRMNLPVLMDQIDNIGEGLAADCRIDTPTLFINGGDSNYVQEKDVALIKTIFPHSIFKTIPHAGHWLHAEKPEAFLHDVMTFLG